MGKRTGDGSRKITGHMIYVDDNEDTGFYVERYGKPPECLSQKSAMI